MYHINTKTDVPDVGYLEATLSRLMARGIKLDKNNCAKLKVYYSNLRESLRDEMQDKYGIANPNSSKQITGYLINLSSQVNLESSNDIINICYDERSDKWTSNAEAMEKLSDLGFQIATDLLEYRQAKKYAESIESLVSLVDSEDLIHPMVSLGKTHRINYSKPGLMSIPKKLLWHLISPLEKGNTLYSVDIKNQEPSILINLTGVEELKPALTSEEGLYETLFKNCFRPFALANVIVDSLDESRIYTVNELQKEKVVSPAMYKPMKPMIKGLLYKGERVVGIETICTACKSGNKPELPETIDIETESGNIYSVNVAWEEYETKYKKQDDYQIKGYLQGLSIEISKAERNEFKTAWLAISYGATSFGIQNMCKTIDGKHIYNYTTKIKGLKEYRSKIDKLAKSGINTLGTAFGTRVCAGDQEDPKRLRRILLDLPIQGTAADILALLVKHFNTKTLELNMQDKVILYYTRHDEFIIEVNHDWELEVGQDYVINLLRDILEHQVDDWTPFKVEVQPVTAEELGVYFDED